MKALLAVLIVVVGFSSFGKSQPGNKTQIALSEMVQKQAKEIKVLKDKIAVLEQRGKASAKKVLSKNDLRNISKLKRKIKLLDSKIEDYQNQAKNPVVFGSLRAKDNRKGWRYKKGGDFFSSTPNPLNTLPKDYKKKKIKIVYYTKAERKEVLKKRYSKNGC